MPTPYRHTSVPPPRKQILLALYVYDERLHRGVLRYGREHGWDVELIQPHTWQKRKGSVPNGILSMVEYPKESTGMNDFLFSLEKPMVDFSTEFPEAGMGRVLPDLVNAGSQAAEYFIQQGQRNFLYVSKKSLPTEKPSWHDLERIAGFRSTLSQHGFGTDELALDEDEFANDDVLALALCKFPRPLAVFCSFDSYAKRLCDICRVQRWNVPKDIAILGCYNHELESALAETPISTIDIGIEHRGYLAATLLDKILQGKADPLTVIRAPIVGIIERESTRRLAEDPLVKKVHRFIEKNLHLPISVETIAKSTNVSRPVLQRHFHQAYGHGVAKTVLSARIEKAKRLLRETDLSESEIAHQTGFADLYYFCHAFKKYTSVTAGAYRREKIFVGSAK